MEERRPRMKALKYSCLAVSIILVLSPVLFAIGIFTDSEDLKVWAVGIQLVCYVVLYILLLILIILNDDPNRPKH